MEQISNNYNKTRHQLGWCRSGYGEYRINSIKFDTPLPLDKAINEICSNKSMVESLSDYRYFSNKTLKQIKKDLTKNDKIKDIQVTGMIDFGQTAMVFETTEGDVLKITNREHFLGRKPQDFDIPIKSHAKLSPKSFCHYYLEEKVSNIFSNNEAEDLKQEIKNKGYKVVDFRNVQIGKTKDGKMVLIDPECARKNNILGFFVQKFSKFKSYLKIIK